MGTAQILRILTMMMKTSFEGPSEEYISKMLEGPHVLSQEARVP